MRIALFVPCYIDQFYPAVGAATLRILESLGHSPDVPLSQSCCGQPMMNAGAIGAALPLMRGFKAAFDSYDYVVCPSGSCVSMVRNHYPDELQLTSKVMELCEFLHDVAGATSFPVPYPRSVALHQGCHGLRELGLGTPSESGGPAGTNKVEALLRAVPGLRLVSPSRTDECCGFGGTFAVAEPEVSSAMGCSRLEDFLGAGADTVTSADMSCLMHLDGLIKRKKLPLRIAHVAEILGAAS